MMQKQEKNWFVHFYCPFIVIYVIPLHKNTNIRTLSKISIFTSQYEYQ